MKLLSPAISRLARLRAETIEYWMNHPVEAQREVLQQLVTDAQYTEFGKKHNFTRTFRIRDLKEQVPIQTYESLEPYIGRMMEGEDNLLWNTPVSWFAKSSGTTAARSKFIPVSKESLDQNHYMASKDVLTLYYQHYPDSDLLTGKGLVIGGSHQIAQINEDINYGDLSAVLLQNAPFWGQWLRTPELSVALMDDWESKIERLARETVIENVTSISGVPTWTLVLMRHILAITGKGCMAEVWPNLELYFHGGVSFTPYRHQFEQLMGQPIRYLEMYNASEGFFAAQSKAGEPGMLLFVQHGIFYEFMPVEEYGAANPRTIGLRDVEIGKNYALVISTNGGLWRYLVGDTIQFTTLYPFRIKVTGRLRHFINAFGEEVIVENTDKAIAMASIQTCARVKDYTAAPVYFADGANGCHEWAIEFDQLPDNLDEFAQALDEALRLVNSDYDAKRHKDIALRRLMLHAVPAETFHEWLRNKGKLGGQHKVPRLSNERGTLEEILLLSAARSMK
jgi:hypothetical protein